MDITLALLLFSFIILLYWVITEVFTFIFRLTGLPAEKARFQVISLLTGCGFTTRESEMILSSRRRRRLARITMLFGYVFNVTIVSAFINVFLSMKLVQVGYEFLSLLIPLAAVAVIFIFMRVPKIHAWGDNLLRSTADRIFDRQETFNAVMLVERNGGKPEARQADTVFEPGDKLTVFGDYQTICKTFHAREHFADD